MLGGVHVWVHLNWVNGMVSPILFSVAFSFSMYPTFFYSRWEDSQF